MKDLSKALSMLSIPRKILQNASSTSEMESEDDVALPKPKFQLGALTSVYGSDIALKLGSSLAALANYNRDGEGTFRFALIVIHLPNYFFPFIQLKSSASREPTTVTSPNKHGTTIKINICPKLIQKDLILTQRVV